MIEIGDLELGHFAGREGEAFGVETDEGGRIELTLVEVLALGSHDPGSRKVRTDPFSLLFHGPREPVLLQRQRSFEHATLGRCDLFLVPIDRDDEAMVYEAVFT